MKKRESGEQHRPERVLSLRCKERQDQHRKLSGWMRTLFRKQAAMKVACEFESRNFRLQPSHKQRTKANIVLWPSGDGSSLTRSGSGVRVPPGLLHYSCPGTPTGRATWFKPKWMQVRVLLWVLQHS